MKHRFCAVFACVQLAFISMTFARPVTANDLQAAHRWLIGWLPKDASTAPEAGKLPFSFELDGHPSSQILAAWTFHRQAAKLDAERTEISLIWTEPAGGLEVRFQGVVYKDYSVVEWTIHFRNTGHAHSATISNIQGLNASLSAIEPAAGDSAPDPGYVLHAFNGSHAGPDDYAPRQMPLGPRGAIDLSSRGWATTDAWPYANLQWNDAQNQNGVIVACGWPGSWTMRFVRDENSKITLTAGLMRFASYLKPGEEARSPLIALLFWRGGDWIDAQNIWRRWMVDHNLPRPGGKLVKPFTATCVDGIFPGMLSNAADEIKSMDRYLAHHARLDYWWIDAGWYPAQNNWTNVGTWEPDPKRYPHGIKEVSDHAHAHGLKLVLWFEPERVTPHTWLWDHHPQWLLGGGNTRLLNLGDPEARAWLTDHISNFIREQGVDLYRQDFNMNPADAWASGDGPGRTGITEMKDVMGYLAYWDELQRRFPNMPIDSCASGGRRNDLETLRRALPLLRSDYRFEPNGTQGHNYGLCFWEPFNGTGVEPASPYVMRSHFCSCYAYGGPDLDPHFDFDGRNRIVAEWAKISDTLQGDYYPLTAYSLSPKVWMAWQFDRPEWGRGMLQVFRRSEAGDGSERLQLRGLDPAASYVVKTLDSPSESRMTGKNLMNPGLLVDLPARASAMTLTYERMQ